MQTKKSLGQNWLKSESAVREIIKTANLKAGELVLEIGPGRGVLTKALLENGAKVLAVEKDGRLIEELREKFAEKINEGRLILIHNDILKIDFSDLFYSLLLNHKTLTPTYKLVANIPYYITGQIIRKFLSEEKNQPNLIVLMMQKEVAERIMAKPHKITPSDHRAKESLLSISVKIYGTPRYIKTVPAGAFKPKPKVDSAILLIENISRVFFLPKPGLGRKKILEQKFFAILKKGFSQKRKLLKNNLKVREGTLLACDIPAKARAENLTVENWGCLVKILNK